MGEKESPFSIHGFEVEIEVLAVVDFIDFNPYFNNFRLYGKNIRKNGRPRHLDIQGL